MKNLTEKQAQDIADQLIKLGEPEDAEMVLEHWENIKVNDGILMVLDESDNRTWMPMGITGIEIP